MTFSSVQRTSRGLALASLASLLSACPEEERACDTTQPGILCTIAGTGESGYAGEEGPALEASLSLPQDTLTAPDGVVYILDWNNHRIRKLTSDGVIHHVAGRGELGGTLDDPANSDFNHPTGLVFDPSGTRLVVAAWHNSKIRTVDLGSGDILDNCGDGRRAYFGDELAALTASLDLPASLAWAPDGRLIVMDQANQVLRAIDADGIIHRVAGRCVIDRPPPSGPGPCADGTLPVACPAPSGKTTCGDPAMTCSLPCNPGYVGDDIAAADMRMAQPFGQSADPAGRIVFDPDGNLYFADTANAMIRMIDAAGMVHRVAGLPPVDGVAQSGYAGDGGPALEAKLNNPVDLALAADGTLYVSDVYNHCVRAIDPAGMIRTVAGICGQPGYEGDGGPATEATLKRAYGIEVVNDKLLITDTGNNVIRQVLLQ